MRIVFLVSSLNAGGAERVAVTLCNSWADRGYNVSLVVTYSKGGASFYEVDKRVNLVVLADRVRRSEGASGYFQRFFELRRFISAVRPDVVVSFLSHVNVVAILATAFQGVPVVCCERRNPTQRISRFWEIACRVLYRFADVLLVQTEDAVSVAKRWYPGACIESVPNPLPPAVLEMPHCGSCGPRKVLLSLGRLSDEKRTADVVEVFASLAPCFPDWDLHVYGDGPELDRISKKINGLNMVERVFLKGKTQDPWKVMQGADLFVMASIHEGFPNALLEAMGVGLPSVVYDCDFGPRDITEGGRCAALVPLNDRSKLESELRRLMRDALERNDLGARARASIIHRYESEKVLGKWESIFSRFRVRH